MKYIYALLDPRTQRVRYIGQAKKPKVRFSAHLCDKKKSRRCRWIRALLAAGLEPVLRTLAIVESFEADSTEVRAIAAYRNSGHKLVNSALGGAGAPGVRQSADHIAKSAAARRGKKRSEETRARMAAARVGRTLSHEHRAKIAAGISAALTNPQLKRQRAEAMRERMACPEYRRKVFTAIHSPESQAKAHAAIVGIKHSRESVARRSGANHWTRRRKEAARRTEQTLF